MIAELAEEKKSDEGFMRVGRLFISSRKFFMKMKEVLQCRTYGRDKNKIYGRHGRFYSGSGFTAQNRKIYSITYVSYSIIEHDVRVHHTIHIKKIS